MTTGAQIARSLRSEAIVLCASVGSTNGTSLRRNPLILKDLQLLPDGQFKFYENMCCSIRGCKTSGFVFIETVFINVIQHPTTPKFAVKPWDIDVFAKASAIRVVGPTRERRVSRHWRPVLTFASSSTEGPEIGAVGEFRDRQRLGVRAGRPNAVTSSVGRSSRSRAYSSVRSAGRPSSGISAR